MKVVSKYTFQLIPQFALQMSPDFEPLTIAREGSIFALWVREDDSLPRVTVGFSLVVDEREAPPGPYIGTIIEAEGDLVLHLFQRHAEKSAEERLSGLERRVGNLEGHRRRDEGHRGPG